MSFQNHGTHPKDQLEQAELFGLASIGFILLHLLCLTVIWLEFNWAAFTVFLVTYTARAFGLTAGFHRYFSHRAFKTSRFFQFVLAWVGTAALQRGPLWWAAHHRHHHPNADTEKDIHSPRARNLWWSHVGWLLCPKYDDTKIELVKDLVRYPELRWIDRYFLVPPATLALTLWVGGTLSNQWFPGLHLSGLQMLIYGFVLSTVLLYHATFCVNSVAHKYGSRRFLLKDESRNNFWVAFVTLGEGWHNNHHYYPASARQGFYWWEIDVTFYVLKGLAWLGVIWEANGVPPRIFQQAVPARDIRSGSA